MLDELQEERMAAALCHASAVVPFWGMAVPFIVWLGQKDRSQLIRYQALQALIYQLIAIVAYFVYSACMPVISFSVIAFMAVFSADPNALAVILLLFFVLMMAVGIGSVVVILLYWIFVVVAVVRVLKGKPFQYPLLGRVISRWVKS